MLSSLWKRVFGGEPPLVQTPSAGRPRTYTADSGYIYEYTFAGFRRRPSQVEYVWNVAAGRNAPAPLQIVLTMDRLKATLARERELTASERYGIAKIALKRALDSAEHPGLLPGELVVDQVELEEIGVILDL